MGLALSSCSVDLTDAGAQGEAEVLPLLCPSTLPSTTMFASNIGVSNVLGVGQISSGVIRVKSELP